MTTYEQFCADYPVIHTQSIDWGDMDSFRHVNNVAYFRYFENARLKLLSEMGWLELMQQTQIGPIVASTQARYRRALTWPDPIEVGVAVSDISEDRFTLRQAIFSTKLQEIATEGQVVIVAYHYGEFRKAALPESMREKLLVLRRSPA